jgi:hypothetical protein
LALVLTNVLVLKPIFIYSLLKSVLRGTLVGLTQKSFENSYLAVIFSQCRYFKESCDVPIIFQRAEASFPSNEVIEDHSDSLKLGGVGEVVTGHHQQGGQVDSGVLVRLNLEPATVPVNCLKMSFLSELV